jgi:hypothetical protein
LHICSLSSRSADDTITLSEFFASPSPNPLEETLHYLRRIRESNWYMDCLLVN